MNTDPSDKLEASIHRVLRSVPQRKAPLDLERRVLAEISRRAALPWWRKSFAHWPSAVRMSFFLASAAAAGALVSALILIVHSTGAQAIAGDFNQRLGWLVIGRELAASASLRLHALAGSVPALWLYAAAAVAAFGYATLAALGAATYRAFHNVHAHS